MKKLYLTGPCPLTGKRSFEEPEDGHMGLVDGWFEVRLRDGRTLSFPPSYCRLAADLGAPATHPAPTFVAATKALLDAPAAKTPPTKKSSKKV